MNRVIHFEIHSSNPEELAKFYTNVFGWEIKEWEMPGLKLENRFWYILTAPKESKDIGINGGLVVRKGEKPKGGETVNAFVCTIDVPNVDEYIKKILDNGGTIALPKMAIPGMAWLAYLKDVEGNIFGIFESDPSAKN